MIHVIGSNFDVRCSASLSQVGYDTGIYWLDYHSDKPAVVSARVLGGIGLARWVSRMIQFGTGTGGELLRDIEGTDNTARADDCLRALEDAGLIVRGDHKPDFSTRVFREAFQPGLGGHKNNAHIPPREFEWSFAETA